MADAREPAMSYAEAACCADVVEEDLSKTDEGDSELFDRVSVKEQGDPCSERRKKSFQFLRARLETTEQGDVEDRILERFLAINGMDLNAALESLLKYLKWWRSFAPLGYISDDRIANECRKGKICVQGHDRKGRSIGVFLAARHDAFNRNLEEFKCYIIYAIEKAISCSKHESLELVAIVDLAGWGLQTVDVTGYLASLEILQEHYLKHLGRMILIHVPFIFWAAYKVTYPFFNDSTKEKMTFVEDRDLKTILLQEVDEDQLPDIYGGKLALQSV